MSTLQVRDVPEELAREMKARAARAGLSLSAYTLQVLVRECAIPSRAEVLDRLALRETPILREPIAQAVSADRR